MLLGLLVLAAAKLSRRSAGCVSGELHGDRLQRSLAVTTTPTTTSIERSFLVTAPANPSKTPMPVVFMYHGWGDTGKSIAEEHIFDDLAKEHGFVAVYPEGMADYQSAQGQHYGSWNDGADPESNCLPSLAKSSAACYDSCNGCTACSWHTCVDDAAFTDAITSHLVENACIDTSRLYAYGESNGGMMVYELLKQRPNMFAAAAVEQGLPASSNGEPGLPPVKAALLHLHDREDRSVPIDGSLSDDGWKYASLSKTLQSACGSSAPPEAATKNATASSLMDCSTYSGCEAGEVVSCLYDGSHGDLPPGEQHSDRFLWNFFNRHNNALPYSVPGQAGGSELLARRQASAQEVVTPNEDMRHA